jgi:hypothetical protein
VIFSYTSNHNVHIHPTGNCTKTGSILVGAQGAGTASYIFKEEEVNTTVFFACDYQKYCEFGQFVNFNVVEEINTMAPSAASDAPSMTTMAPSVSPTFASMAPSGSPSTSMAPSGSPSSAPSGMPVEPTSIIDLAEAAGNYGTLLGAIIAADLLPTIADEAPISK